MIGYPLEMWSVAVLVIGAALVLLFVTPLTTRTPYASSIGIIALAVAAGVALDAAPQARLAVWAVCVAAGVALLLAPILELEQAVQRPEAVALVLLAAGGGIALATGADLVQIAVGLETLSLSVAVLVALGRGERPLEASFRYFVLAAVSLAIYLYGLGLIYLATGSVALPTAATLANGSSLLYGGLVLIALGVAFELAVVPLQWGLLDVYTAAPPATAGFAMAVAEVSAVIALARIVGATGAALGPVFIALGILSVGWGTFGALAQRDVRRMLGYSTVMNAGIMMLALASGPSGRAAAQFYVVLYSATIVLIFASLAGRGTGPLPFGTIKAEGMGPLRAAGLALGLFSLAGIPPTPVFWAKLAVLGPMWQVAGPIPTIIAVAGAVIGVLYYLRPLPDLLAAVREVAVPRPLVGWAVALAGLVVVILGILPNLGWSLVGLASGG